MLNRIVKFGKFLFIAVALVSIGAHAYEYANHGETIKGDLIGFTNIQVANETVGLTVYDTNKLSAQGPIVGCVDIELPAVGTDAVIKTDAARYLSDETDRVIPVAITPAKLFAVNHASQ